MEAAYHITARRHNSEDRDLYLLSLENPKPQTQATTMFIFNMKPDISQGIQFVHSFIHSMP